MKGAVTALKTRSVETKAVTDLAALAVFTASKDGGMIAADVEARRLLDEYPNCQIPSRSCGTPLCLWRLGTASASSSGSGGAERT